MMGSRVGLNPPLPEAYFGTSVQSRVATTKVGELVEKGLGWGALRLNQVIKSHNDVTIQCSRESWVENPVLAFLSNNSLVSKYLSTGSSPRFNVYENDFGWGQPIAVRSGSANRYDAKITVFPGSVEGSIDIEACLSPETLKVIEDDAEFMEAVTVLPPFQQSA
ncbi:Transferase [Macleaya cordata]|uniref:Transferase n=1 Tax=Macleaya cordata TaxID=56857 RepID=A0A200QWW8_MACCD|nr:Transferase [Macleaya cordata]